MLRRPIVFTNSIIDDKLVTCLLFTPAKASAAQNVVALSYHRVRGLYFLAVIFAASCDYIYKRTAFFWFNFKVRIILLAPEKIGNLNIKQTCLTLRYAF